MVDHVREDDSTPIELLKSKMVYTSIMMELGKMRLKNYIQFVILVHRLEDDVQQNSTSSIGARNAKP